TVNFSYVEEMNPPTPMYDEFQVAFNTPRELDVLANDEGEGLRIIALNTFFDSNLFPGSPEITGSQGFNNQIRINEDGTRIIYNPPQNFFGFEAFYYIIEDSQGRRDFEQVFIEIVFELEKQFAANDDFATIPVTSNRTKINVLANDSVTGGGSKEQLVITDISTPTAGGRVSFQGSDVTYWPPPDFLGIDTFVYTMTDGFSGTDTATVSVSVNESPVSNQRRALLNLFLKLFGSSQGGGAIFALFNNHMNEINYIILDQDGGSVAPKANGKSPLSRLQVGGTADTQARLNALLDLAEPGFVAVVTGQGDSVMVTQELVDQLMNQIAYVEERASPDLKADLQTLSEMTNDFQDLVGKTFNESASILGLEPDKISIPYLALERINDVFSITTYDVVGVAYKLWKSNNLQPDSWEEVQNAEVEKKGQRAKISDPDIGDEDVFYRVTTEVE
ncbi:MAG: Ig-like domain-containing protein, partial [Verrucomicrobia bacterium]|nr:Ig-like domain-containing protein [Verrucomicrobiota bacterium]